MEFMVGEGVRWLYRARSDSSTPNELCTLRWPLRESRAALNSSSPAGASDSSGEYLPFSPAKPDNRSF